MPDCPIQNFQDELSPKGRDRARSESLYLHMLDEAVIAEIVAWAMKCPSDMRHTSAGPRGASVTGVDIAGEWCVFLPSVLMARRGRDADVDREAAA